MIQKNERIIKGILHEAFESRSRSPWKEPFDKYDHGIRTAKLGLHLEKLIFPNEDAIPNKDTFVVAAWFHDVCNGEDHHEELGAKKASVLLKQLCSPEELSDICRMIKVHDSRSAENKDTFPAEIKILQDADMLDHLGTYSIWSTLCKFSYQHKTPKEYAEQFTNGIFDRFVDRWRPLINYPVSLAIFDEKIAYEKSFADRMLRELKGYPS